MQLLCNVGRISNDSVYPALSYHKNQRRFCKEERVQLASVLNSIKIQTVYNPV